MAHSRELKEQILAYLWQGHGVRETARKYGLSESTVRGFRDESSVKLRENARKADMQATFDRVLIVFAACWETLEEQLKIARDPQYLKIQDAAGLAKILEQTAQLAANLSTALANSSYDADE